jgi:hypothetical protein
MNSAIHAPKTRSRSTALLSTLIAVALLLLGAASAQAKPSETSADFLMEVDSTSASFTPVADAPGEYELVLRGVTTMVENSELTKAGGTAKMPLNHFLAYWMSYGDVTGQFNDNPPRAVLHGLDTGEGIEEEVVVRLRDASRAGKTLTFKAEIIESTRVFEVLEKKITMVDETLPLSESELEPTSLTSVKMFVDMPQRIVQPDTEEAESRLFSRANVALSPALRTLTCNGVKSSQLVTCWADIGDYREESADGIVCKVEGYGGFRGYTPGRGFYFDRVGQVDLMQHHWNPGTNFMGNNNYRNPPHLDDNRCIRYFEEGNWYGIHRSAVTMYTTDDCSYFLAKVTRWGKCW